MYRLIIVAIVVTSPLASGANAYEKPRGFDSPDAAFRAYVTGAVTEDFDLMLSSLTRESKAYHIGLSVFSATFLFGEDPAMQKALRDHGPQRTSDADEEGESDEAKLVDAMLRIKDPGKRMKKIADRHYELAKQLAEPDDPATGSKRPTKKEQLALISSVTLENVKIANSSATASVRLAPAARDARTHIPSTIHFRRINSRWYCDIDPR